MTVPLFDHQVQALNFLENNPKSLCIIQMGGGKTRIIIELLKRLNLRNVFIVSLANIIKNTWTQELEKWGYPYEYKLYHSSKALSTYSGGLCLANIDLAVPFINKWNDKLDAVIIDESSILKTPKTRRFKLIKNISTKRIHMLSALPAPNGFHNLFTQVFIIDKGQRFGQSYDNFIHSNFITKEVRAYVHMPVKVRAGHDTLILNKINDISYFSPFERVRSYEVKEENVFFNIPFLTNLVYKKVKREGVYKNMSIANAGTKFNKLRQLLSGFIYINEKERSNHDDARLQTLKDLLTRHKAGIIIIYNFIAEMDDIVGLLKKLNISFSLKAREYIKGDFRCFVANAKSVGMGLNLQKANVLIWYSQTLSFEALFQMRGRIDRTGQTKDVYIYNILAKNELEAHIYKSLKDKKEVKEIIESFFKKENTRS